MTAYFIRRFLLIIPTFLGVTVLVFAITRMVPGGPVERDMMRLKQASAQQGGGGATLGADFDEEKVRRELEKAYGLDKPWVVQYLYWAADLARLDLGVSEGTSEPVWDRIKERFPVSLTFGLSGFILAYLICIPLGIAKALRHGSTFDLTSSAIVFLGYSIPGWAVGLLLLLVLSSGRYLDWMPLGETRSNAYEQLPSIVQGSEPEDDLLDEYYEFDWDRMSMSSRLIDRVYHMILPVFCYMMGSFAALTVLMKNSLMENLGHDYVRTAFAKGLAPRRVIFVHTLRNSMIPLATGLGHALSVLLAGSFLIEYAFNIEGMGLLGFTSLMGHDYPVVMGVLVVTTLLALLGNIFSDILYALIDPRIRFE